MVTPGSHSSLHPLSTRLLGRAVAGGLMGLLLLTSCGDAASGPASETPSVSESETRRQLADAMAVWEAAGIDDYDMRYRAVCFCPEIVVAIEVRDGAVVKRTLEGAETTEVIDGVGDLFAQIEKALDAGAHAVEVAYDPTYGLPTRVFIDEMARVADEEHGVEVLAFDLA